MDFYAHTDPEYPNTSDALDYWEPLFSPECVALGGEACGACERMDRFHGHLNKVAWWTAKFASSMFESGSDEAKAAWEWGYLAGLWHDLGKYTPEWQAYLSSKSDIHADEVQGKIDHATAGAKYAVDTLPVWGHLFAFVIAGHHSGLIDAISDSACLEKRLKKPLPNLSHVPHILLERQRPKLPRFVTEKLTAGTMSTYCRMIFSCLTDADFLCTEAFMSPVQVELRPCGNHELFPKMLQLLQQKIDDFGLPVTQVEKSRAQVYQNCLGAAEKQPGLFSLNVPTGGGKTLSSLAFALQHAITHGQQRVIYVIPFTSIIEQNAGVFEEIFSPLNHHDSPPIVVQHHSNLSPDKESTRSRLAAENWDAPLIVTTAVQFYESLHAARTSSCRKLHHIANAVVILDEAQCLPVDYLKPCLQVLEELSSHYRTSVVLCTATQPAIHHRPGFDIGLKQVRSIIPNPETLAQKLERVKIVDRGPLDDALLAHEISSAEQALAIVNTRKHAQALFQLLPEGEGTFHLSALMCPAHRQTVLKIVRERVQKGLPTRLISTQLIEAGVDVDFPLVYRSLAGLDSIAQAAGRCNRNGKLAIGETHVFRSEHQRAEIYFRKTAQIANQVLALYPKTPLSLESIEKYFDLYYLGHNPPGVPRWDTKDIIGECKLNRHSAELPFGFQFKTIAEKFRLIENDQVPVLIPFDAEAHRLVTELRNPYIPLNRRLLRSLQQYTVQIYKPEFIKHQAQFESLRDNAFHVLICPETHYSERFGLQMEPVESLPLIC